MLERGDGVARVLIHIPQHGKHAIHYYGQYPNRSKSKLPKDEALPPATSSIEQSHPASPSSLRRRWAELLRRLYEVAPLICSLRMALGARASEIQTLFVRDGILPVLVGVAIGCGASGMLSRFVGSVLYGVPATDFLTFAAAALVLVAVATLASYVPARRASTVDPKVTLQHE